MKSPLPFGKKQRPPGAELDNDDVEAVILRNLWKHHRILPPTSKYKSYWDAIMFTFVVYNSLYIPIEIAFTLTKVLAHCVIDYLIDALFITDMLLNLRTTYYNEENELVLDARTIYRRYLFSYWFVIDVVAVLPFELLTGQQVCSQDGSQDTAAAQIVKMLKALRLLRLMRFRKELDKLSGAQVLRTVVSLSVFLLIAHWLACVWWGVGVSMYAEDDRIAQLTTGGVVICNSSVPCSWLRRIPAGAANLSPDSTLAQQYLTSFYWSLTTLMKTPAVGPDTVAEKIFAICAIALGAIFYAFFLSTVQGNFSSFNKAAAQKRDKLATISSFSSTRNLSGDMTQRLVRQVTAQFEWTSGLKNSFVLQQLPSNLRGLVAQSLYPDARSGAMSMFSKCSAECAKLILTRLETHLLLKDEVLISKGHACSTLYILLRGILRATPDKPEVHKPGRHAEDQRPTDTSTTSGGGVPVFRDIERPGSQVGLVEPTNPKAIGLFPFWVTAMKKTYTLTITQQNLAGALSGFDEDLEAIRKLLTMEHKALVDGLKIPEEAHSPLFLIEREQEKERLDKDQAASSAASLQAEVTDDVVKRVGDIEGRVLELVERLEKVHEGLQALPRILELVSNRSKLMKVRRFPQGR